MRVVNLLTLLAASCTIGCATPSRLSRIETCLTDPKNNAMHCDGVTKSWESAVDYVCHPLDEHEEYFRGCR